MTRNYQASNSQLLCPIHISISSGAIFLLLRVLAGIINTNSLCWFPFAKLQKDKESSWIKRVIRPWSLILQKENTKYENNVCTFPNTYVPHRGVWRYGVVLDAKLLDPWTPQGPGAPGAAIEILLFDKCAKMWKSLENSGLQEKTTGTRIRLYGIFNVYCNAEDGSRLFSCEVETTLRYQTWEVCAISSTACSKPWKLSWTSLLSVTGVPQNMQLHVYTNGLLLIELHPP